MSKKTNHKAETRPTLFSAETIKLFLANKQAGNLNDHVKVVRSQLHPNHKLYFIGGNFPDIYFTSREAECMALLLKGKNIKNTSIVLGLSARTVGYYIKTMRLKLGCSNKSQLIEAVFTTDFYKEAEKLYSHLMLTYFKRQKSDSKPPLKIKAAKHLAK